MAAEVRTALLVLAALTAPAVADPAFGWQAPAKCPSADDVRARVERRLAAPLDAAVRGVDISITQEGSELVAKIDARALTVANDVRTLRSARCEELADAIAVVIARLANEARAAQPEQTSVVAAPPRVAELQGPEDARRADIAKDLFAPRRRPQHTWGGGIRVLGLSGVGALPRINLGGELAGYVRRKHHFAELAVARWVPQSARLDPGAPARVDVSLDVVALRVGWGPEHLPIRAWGSTEVGTMKGEGLSVIDPRTASGRWIAIGGGFGVAWPMARRARLVGTFELAIPLQRTKFMLENGADLYQPSAAAARCALGLELGWR